MNKYFIIKYMKRYLWLSGVATLLLIVVSLTAPQDSFLKGNQIIDVSWPNCKKISNLESYYGIVGANGGLDFKPNPCLNSETNSFEAYQVYINTGYAGVSLAKQFQYAPHYCSLKDQHCLAYNYGYNATLYAIRYANMNNVHSTFWWIDVESDNSWSSPPINRQSLRGSIAALKNNLFDVRVGIYSYPGQWDQLTKNWRPNLPAWVATGSLRERDALNACAQPSFTDDPVYLSQYTLRFDENINCKINKVFVTPAGMTIT